MEFDSCPCGSGKQEPDCCERIRRAGAGLGTTAEQLMRARYCAFVREDDAFLLASWHPDTAPATIDFDPDVTWIGLDVLDVADGSAFDTVGTVEFRAHLRRGKQHQVLHERSSFVQSAGQWRYVSGTVPLP